MCNRCGVKFDLLSSITAYIIYQNVAIEKSNKIVEIIEKDILVHWYSKISNRDLAGIYYIFGCFYHNQGNVKLAEEYFQSSRELRELLAKENPNRYNGDLAKIYNNLGIFYYKQGQAELAKEYFAKAKKLSE